MNRYAAFLRGINVGGHRKIKMEKLRRLFADWGFQNVSTYIQSGNIVFDADENDSNKLAGQLKQFIFDSLGFDVPVIVRTIPEIKATLQNNPFAEVELDKNTKLYITFLSHPPEKEKINTLHSFQNEAEQFKVIGKDIYVLIHKDKAIKPVYSNSFVERKLDISATNRNWRTVNKMYEMGKSE